MKTDFTGPLATEFAGRPRRTDRPILLVGFVEQGNLTRIVGWRVVVADVDQDPESVLKVAEAERPIVIFSLIFQFYIRRYRAIRRLRAARIEVHITMGGHFPSLATAAAFAEVPELDSVVQYEGELTLARAGRRALDGRRLAGYRGHRPPAGDRPPALRRDTCCPWPKRDYEPETVLGHRLMPLLVSRGCARTCSRYLLKRAG